jgi:hypothetical protein
VVPGTGDTITATEPFEGFYERSLDTVFRTILLVTRHPQRAEDAAHVAAWASTHCTNTALPLFIQDQRGAASFFVFQRSTTFLACIVWTVDRPNESGWVSGSFTGDFNPSTSPVDLWSNLLTEAADQGSVESAVGSAPGAASVIIVTEDGRRIQASLRDGTFAAWWPTKDIGVRSLREIDAYRSDGILLGRLDFPASSASPRVPATPDSMPSGPPIPAAS